MTYIVAIAICLGMCVLLLALVAVFSRANDDVTHVVTPAAPKVHPRSAERRGTSLLASRVFDRHVGHPTA